MTTLQSPPTPTMLDQQPARGGGSTPCISIEGLCKSFGDQVLYDDLQLQIPDRQITNARIQVNLVRANGGRGLTAANGFTGGNVNSFQNDRTELRTQYQVAF